MRFFKPLDYMGVGHSDNGSYYNHWSQIPVSIVQAWYYYIDQNDLWPIKLLVTWILFCFPVNIFIVLT